jgi:hypothetical protein
MRFVMIAGCALLSSQLAAVAQTTTTAKECKFADRLYSQGAYLCVAAGTVNRCQENGAWKAEDTPTCKEPNNPPPVK